LPQEQCASHINSTDTSVTGHSASEAGPSNTDRKNIQCDAVLNTPDRSTPNIKKTNQTKKTPKRSNNNKKNPHRTEAKNKIWQYCFSSALALGLKGKGLQQAVPTITLDSGSQTTQLVNSQ